MTQFWSVFRLDQKLTNFWDRTLVKTWVKITHLVLSWNKILIFWTWIWKKIEFSFILFEKNKKLKKKVENGKRPEFFSRSNYFSFSNPIFRITSNWKERKKYAEFINRLENTSPAKKFRYFTGFSEVFALFLKSIKFRQISKI